MQRKGNDGVSPVIAVILILMLTVLLVGIIGALFMGMSSDTVHGINTSFLQPKHEWDVIKLVYNGNGNTDGEIPVDEGTHKAGDAVVVADGSKVYREGYTFACWTTNADNSGEVYFGGDELVLNAYTVLYAQWNENPDWYFVLYEENGNPDAVISASHESAKKGSLVTLIGAESGNSDLEFIEWNTKLDGTGVPYAKGGTYDGAYGTLTMYAQWNKVDSGET